MNQQQRKYATGRIDQISEAKIAAIKAANTTAAVKLPDEEKIEMIRSKKVELIKGTEANRYIYLVNYFDFSKLEKPEVFNKTKADPLIKKINDAAQKAKDEINLGDSEAALKAVAAFEKLK